MTAQGTGDSDKGCVGIPGTFGQDGTARSRIQSGRPVDVHIVVAGDELSGGSVDDIEEAVLRRLHQHLTHASVNLYVGQHDVLGGRIVPRLTRCGLEVPDVFRSEERRVGKECRSRWWP